MSSISRYEPETYDDMNAALIRAKQKNDSLPAGTSPLKPASVTELEDMVTEYTTAMEALAAARYAMSQGTPGKDAAEKICRTYTSHFYQVFNLGVEREVYTAAQRSFFFIPVSSSSNPPMRSEGDLLQAASRIVVGDPNRVTAGGAAMSNPTKAEVEGKYNTFKTLFDSHSNKKDALDTAEEVMEALFPRAAVVIKWIWDELEFIYSREPIESRRDNCREWGVVYVLVGGQKTVSGTITYTGVENPTLRIRFKQGRNKATVADNGAYVLSTTLMEAQVMVIERFGPDSQSSPVKTWERPVTLTENEDLVANFTIDESGT